MVDKYMAHQNIVVIGGSAGALEALKTLAAGLPKDLDAAIFVALHIGRRRSMLPEILRSIGSLPAIHPEDGLPIKNGMIYIAPPDHHILLREAGRISLSRGPKENLTRPAINPLFRSAAGTYGPAVIGIILSGTLDDGVAGLAEIKERGGTAIVQDPKTSNYSSMPQTAIEYVSVDYVVRVDDILALFPGIFAKESTVHPKGVIMDEHKSGLTCPECRGPLTEFQRSKIKEYRCRVGHAYSALSLAQDHEETLERKLWEALVALEESADIAEHMARQPGGAQNQEAANRREQALAIQQMLDS
jgi:two-component system chemotaxis response regulator CheB